MAPPTAAGRETRAVGEDSDVIVALIRTAFILAFIVFSVRAYMRQTAVPMHMDVVLFVTASFTLLCFALYLRGYPLRGQRLFALALDLVLVTATITTLRLNGRPNLGLDLFGLYYLVVIAAAVWYRLAGAVAVGVLALAISAAAMRYLPSSPENLAIFLSSGHPALLLLISVIAGYMMRAREAEQRVIVELRQEMRLARALQSRMLPERLPDLEAYSLGSVFSPARQVGGDFYDLRLLDKDHLLIVLADMSGKSVYGLVHLSLVYSHLQAAARGGHSPAAIARLVNRGTYEALQPESYAAVFIGLLRLSDGLLTFTNCGHVPPVRVRRRGSGEPDLLSTGGTVVGAIRDYAYEERALTLSPGDALVCFSDGVSDARNRAREQFGEGRVAELARTCQDCPAQDIAENLATSAEHFAARPGQDDVTILVICREQ